MNYQQNLTSATISRDECPYRLGVFLGGGLLGFLAGSLVGYLGVGALTTLAKIAGVLVGVIGGGIAGAQIPTVVVLFYIFLRGGSEHLALQRIRRFIDRHPVWSVRLYQTPLGLRLLATHSVFDPTSLDAHDFFQAIRADPVYGQMCRRQACFRARVSPKPWRIGVEEHIRPKTAVWPLPPEKLVRRAAWITEYEEASQGYASCRYVETLGSGVTDPAVLKVQRLHDKLCRAASDLPIA